MKWLLGDYQKGEAAKPFEAIEEVLSKNRARLGVSLTDLATPLPIKERLTKTDRLIDLIVYRLYGLTEEEIGIVEGMNR